MSDTPQGVAGFFLVADGGIAAAERKASYTHLEPIKLPPSEKQTLWAAFEYFGAPISLLAYASSAGF